jgi:glucosamine-6-phosphate deaminase
VKISVSKTRIEMGNIAAKAAAGVIRKAIARKGAANIILATGQSQFEFLESLAAEKVDWSKVEAFHLDEYIGMPITHPASFRKYLKERFVDKLPRLKKFHFVKGDSTDPAAECRRAGKLISKVTIDVACIGIGENGHLAFNDPPADFQTQEPYIIVSLDDACRRQQLGEGWFPTFEDVPTRAISMSIRQIMKSLAVVCTVPDSRKAVAVRNTLEEPVSNRVPASILREHPNCRLFLDEAAAVLLATRQSR